MAQKTMSKPLTFGELKQGDKFIVFPEDGDDHGHGGFRNGAWIMMKTEPTLDRQTIKLGLKGNIYDNYIRLVDGVHSSLPDAIEVIKVF